MELPLKLQEKIRLLFSARMISEERGIQEKVSPKEKTWSLDLTYLLMRRKRRERRRERRREEEKQFNIIE